MRELIVNADDFGLTRQVSQGIIDAHREGIVTSTTLLANGAAFDTAVSMSVRTPRLGIGVHLNLSEGTPVSSKSKIPTLLDARGRLHLAPGRLWIEILKRKLSLSEVELELQAQIEKVIRAGISPTHLDGHKHVHVLPGISDIVIRLAQEFGISPVRCPVKEAPNLRRLLRFSLGAAQTPIIKQYLVGQAVSGFAQQFRRKLAEAGLICPSYFYGLSETGFLDVQSLQDVLSRVSKGTSELMCHPGYVDSDLVRTGTRLLSQREIEIQALIAPQVRKLVTDQGIRLVSYGHLAGSRQPAKVAA
jgi:hopanoid biosynthesis associated protein HpnK